MRHYDITVEKKTRKALGLIVTDYALIATSAAPYEREGDTWSVTTWAPPLGRRLTHCHYCSPSASCEHANAVKRFVRRTEQ